VANNRGLEWLQYRKGGGATRNVDGTKVQTMLNLTTQLTLELVLDVHTAASGSGSVLLHLADPQMMPAELSLAVANTGLLLQWSTASIAFSPSVPQGRQVVHVLVDTQSDTQRVRAFVSGQPQSVTGSLAAGSSLDLSNTTTVLILGNDSTFSESMRGILYYAAIYDRPLTAAEIDAHTAILSTDDDTP
jgi:Concanavalin A-like lectin/glucanases superfamily